MDRGQKIKIRKSIEHDKTNIKSIRGFLSGIGQTEKVRKHLMQAEFNLLFAANELKSVGEKEE